MRYSFLFLVFMVSIVGLSNIAYSVAADSMPDVMVSAAGYSSPAPASGVDRPLEIISAWIVAPNERLDTHQLVFYLKNAGKEPVAVATRELKSSIAYYPSDRDRPNLLEVAFQGARTVENIPIVMPMADIGVVKLLPGKAAEVKVDFNLPEDVKALEISYWISERMARRYGIWQGRASSGSINVTGLAAKEYIQYTASSVPKTWFERHETGSLYWTGERPQHLFNHNWMFKANAPLSDARLVLVSGAGEEQVMLDSDVLDHERAWFALRLNEPHKPFNPGQVWHVSYSFGGVGFTTPSLMRHFAIHGDDLKVISYNADAVLAASDSMILAEYSVTRVDVVESYVLRLEYEKMPPDEGISPSSL